MQITRDNGVTKLLFFAIQKVSDLIQLIIDGSLVPSRSSVRLRYDLLIEN